MLKRAGNKRILVGLAAILAIIWSTTFALREREASTGRNPRAAPKGSPRKLDALTEQECGCVKKCFYIEAHSWTRNWGWITYLQRKDSSPDCDECVTQLKEPSPDHILVPIDESKGRYLLWCPTHPCPSLDWPLHSGSVARRPKS